MCCGSCYCRTKYMKKRNSHLFMIMWLSHRVASSFSRYSLRWRMRAGSTVSFKYASMVCVKTEVWGSRYNYTAATRVLEAPQPQQLRHQALFCGRTPLCRLYSWSDQLLGGRCVHML